MSSNYPISIDISLREKYLIEDCLKVIKVVRPYWEIDTVKSKVYTAGLSNKLIGFFIEKSDIVLVRLYGQNTDQMIDRQAEINCIKLLHEKGCGPALYATFTNGICYEFVPGVTLSVDDCKSPKIYPLVAKELATIHSKIPIIAVKAKPQLIESLRNFDRMIREMCLSKDNEGLIKRFSDVGIDITSGFESTIDLMESVLEAQNMPVTFCHNDLNLVNIIYNEKESKVSFIDFEYAMPNYPAFDIANHFLEFPGFDYTNFAAKCPDRSLKSKWIAEYLKHLKLDNWKISQETFEKWVEYCFPFSHLLWTLWSIVQAQNSTIQFDFVGYAGLRYSEYVKDMKNIREELGL